jgi:hypothetical protein
MGSDQDTRSRGDSGRRGILGFHIGGEITMSATLALSLAALTLGSCFACYRLGQQNILFRMRQHDERRRERENRWREFDDLD